MSELSCRIFPFAFFFLCLCCRCCCFFFFVSPKNFLLLWKMFGCCLLSSALPLSCVSLCLLEEDEFGRSLPLGASKPGANARSFLLFSLPFESSLTSRFLSRSSIWGSGFHCRCSTLCRRHSASFHSFVLTERFGLMVQGTRFLSEDVSLLLRLFQTNSAPKSGLFSAAAAAREEHLRNKRSSACPPGRTLFGCWWNAVV